MKRVSRGFFRMGVTGSDSVGLLPKLRNAFRARELFVHDGSAMRRIHISSRSQIMAASAVAAMTLASGGGVAQLVASSIANSEGSVSAREDHIADMEAKVAQLESQVQAVKVTAKNHATRLEARQAVLAAMISGEGDIAELGAKIPAKASESDAVDGDVIAMFTPVDAQQNAMAAEVRRVTDGRLQTAMRAVSKMGLSPDRFYGRTTLAVGGPYEPVGAQPKPLVPLKADPQFRALFNSWRQLDQVNKGIVAIPSLRPVTALSLTSNFGVRSDPFRGGRAMHAGVDIPGAYGTPIYATADGVAGRTGRIGGYGNLIELEHGRGIQTRYGHLSSIVVAPGTRVKRGQLIGLMGSTGRSTGNHLHYEVRIDGRAVNPVPFMQSNDYLASLQERSAAGAVGGPLVSKSDK